jgi:predicted transposase YbfD/YdcC
LPWRQIVNRDRLGRRHWNGESETVMKEREFRQMIVDEFLAFVDDPRVERTRKHPLDTILVIALLAVICGADGFVQIERFAIAKQVWLSEFLDLSGGVPSHDTMGRVFAALNPKSLAEAFRRWTLSLATATSEKLVAIDGKTLRRSFRQAGDNAFVHMVSAWSQANRVVLGQVKTDEKSNEISAIPALLDLINIQGALVTIDAAGTQTSIAAKIVDKGGDYFLAVKGNQPKLHDAVVEHFLGTERRDTGVGYWESNDHKMAHGRREIRRAWVSVDVHEIQTAERWLGLKTLVRIEATRAVNGQESVDNRFYISSRLLSASEALDASRGHWSIENELHWVLDVAFREDECRVRAGNAAENLSMVRQLALSMLKQRTEAKCGIQGRRLMAGWNDQFLLRTVGLAADG